MLSSSIMKVGQIELPSKDTLQCALPMPVLCTYFAFGAVGFSVYHFVAEREFSSILTMSVIAQALAISFLCVQIMWNKSARGISVGALVLDGLSVAGRMPSTTWSEGYLPMDKTGDYLYQTVDFCSLAMILFLLHRVLVVHRSSYDALEDTFKVGPLILAAFVLAFIFHGNAADNPLYDTCWMAGLFMGVVAVLPKLWLVTQSGGTAQAWTCHYIMAMGLCRALSGLFMWEARADVTCDRWISGLDHAIFFILIAHFVHLLLIADFVYSYASAALRNGICNNQAVQMQTMQLPQFV
jgi:hypothetical protein